MNIEVIAGEKLALVTLEITDNAATTVSVTVETFKISIPDDLSLGEAVDWVEDGLDNIVGLLGYDSETVAAAIHGIEFNEVLFVSLVEADETYDAEAEGDEAPAEVTDLDASGLTH